MAGRPEGGAYPLWPPIGLALLLLFVLFPDTAFAHASERGHVLLLPTGHYLVGGAAAVAASFVALVFVPPAWLERVAAMRMPLFAWPDAIRVLTSLAAFIAFVALVLAGFEGSRDPLANPLPLTVWTLLWVGVTLVQGVIGNVWAWINPWYGPWRLISVLLGKRVMPLPRGWGFWPALAAFAAFAWFELIYPAPDDPAVLATAAAIYWLATFTLMLLFGYDSWSRSGEFLSVFFSMLSRFAIFGGEDRPEGKAGKLELGWPGARLTEAAVLPTGGVAFLLLALSSVSFDGLSKTFFWLGLNGVNPLEFPGRTALMGSNTNGLALAFAALAVVFMAVVFAGERLVRSHVPFGQAAGLLVWSIVPIALAYHFSHYLTALLVNGQYAVAALSDPFARGWDLFGTAHHHVHAAIAAGSSAAWVVWNLQAAAIILGHILAVLVAHGLAYRIHADAKTAAVSQIPLTLLMIGYTVFGLWLLSTPTAG
jgi:hypothetical protein